MLGTLVPPARAAAPDLLDVVAVGGSAPLTSAATAVSIVPLLATGVTGTAVALRTTASGAQLPLTLSGSATSEGALSLSSDGRYLTLVGYGTPPGTASVSGTSSASVRRVVGRIDGAGGADTSTALNVFSANNPRGAVTDDGSRFWVTGAGSNDSPKAAMYFAALGATSASALVTPSPTGARVPVIAGSNLYLSTATTVTPGVYEVGSGLPVSGTQATAALVSGASSDPYGFVLVRLAAGSGAADTLYVADGAAIKKYALQGATWVAEGTSAAAGTQLGSLTGRVSGSTVQLYATTLNGGAVLSFADTSAASTAPISGAFATVASAPANTAYRGIAFAPSGQVAPAPAPTATPADSVLGAVLGDPGNPTLAVTVADDDPSVAPSDLQLSAASSNPAVVPSSAITLTGSGATRTVALAPVGRGYATITLTVTAPGGHIGTAQFQYGASLAAGDATSHWLDGASDASTAIDVGGGYMVVGDDTSNVLRLYRGDASGLPLKTWDFASQLGVTDQIDIEAAARLGGTIYWTGSMGNSSKGNIKPDESTLFSTAITGSGANTELTLTGFYKNLRNDLIAWDHANGHGLGADFLGFAAGAAAGQLPKQIDGFNVEGMEIEPGGTAYLGFRAPLEPASNRHLALVVPVTNLTSLTSGGATQATFGAPMYWDLGGQSVREIRRNADGQYLVIAGSYAEGGSFSVYAWDGVAAHQPVLTSTRLPSPLGSWESIVAVPDPLTDGSLVQFIEDDGSYDFYGDGSNEAKALALGLRKSRFDTIPVALAAQSIAFTSQPPSQPRPGATYTVAATGGASGNPIRFAVDPSSGAGVCSVAGAVVTLAAAGTCAIDANQAGNGQYAPAAQVAQRFDVFVVTSAPTTASGTVPDTLGLSLDGSTTSLGSFLPAVAGDYTTTIGASVTTSGLQTMLSVADPSGTSTGHLVNGGRALALALQASATDADHPTSAFAAVGSGSSPLSLLSFPSPIVSDPVTVSLRQSILATEPLLAGTYSKTIVFSLSAVTP